MKKLCNMMMTRMCMPWRCAVNKCKLSSCCFMQIEIP